MDDDKITISLEPDPLFLKTIEDLQHTLAEIDAAIAAVKTDVNMSSFLAPEQFKYSNGQYILHPLLVAKAQVLAALAGMLR